MLGCDPRFRAAKVLDRPQIIRALIRALTGRPAMSAVATNRLHGSTAATEILVLEPVAQRMGLGPILLVPGEITLGSSPECQVQLTAAGVQPHHCSITATRLRVTVRAVDRRTWLNNLPLREGALRLGDRLAVGPVEFRVRQADPWDVLPPVEPVEAPISAEVVRAVVKPEAVHEQVKAFESQLLQQITKLETEVARHQAAVARLEERVTTEPPQSMNPAAGINRAGDPGLARPEQVPPSTFTAPRFHFSSPVTSGGPEQHAHLYEELEVHHRQARKQLAELSVRNDLLNRQCLELAAQWEQLRQLIAEQEAATLERTQREQQLYERERRCTFQESEIARRSQRLSEELDKVAARLLQLQAEADQLAGQSALLSEREQNLAERTRQLDAREAEIEQAAKTVEQREADCQNRADVTEAWEQLRQETESRWTTRTQELDARAAALQAQADVLTSREAACEHLRAEVRHDRQQLAADRTHLEEWNQELVGLQFELSEKQQELATLQSELESRDVELQQRDADLAQLMATAEHQREQQAAEQTRLETWDRELTQAQEVFGEQQEQLAQEASRLKTEAQEFVLREYAWEQIVSTTQRDQERLAAEQDRLEALRSDFTARQSELTERQLELEVRSASIESQADELNRREAAVEQAAAALQQEKERLLAEQNRLGKTSNELTARQSLVDAKEQEIATQSANWTSQIDELRARKQAWEQTVAATEQAEEQVLAERYRLEAWHDELSAQQASLAKQREDLQARQTEWEQTRRTEADSTATALTNDYSSIERLRDELTLAERELEHVEAELGAWESDLRRQQAELESRESELHAAQVELTWQQRDAEQLSPRDPLATQDAAREDATDLLERLSHERDALATELFLARESTDKPVVDTESIESQLRRQAAQLARDAEECQQLRKSLEAERLALESGRSDLQQQRERWEAERRDLESALESARSQLAQDQQSLQAEKETLHSRKTDLETEWRELNSERATLDRLSSELQEQQAEHDRQARSLEQQEQRLAARQTEWSQEWEARQSEAAAVAEQELADARRDLAEQQERLKAAQVRFHEERRAWEEDRQAWEEQLAAETGPGTSDSRSSNALDTLSRLDEVVNSELDHDERPDLSAETSDPFEAIRAQYGISRSEYDREELPAEEHEIHEAPRSLWAPDTQDEMAAEGHTAAELPATEEDLSVVDLRARLAEMFSMELSESRPAPRDEIDEVTSIDESEPVESSSRETDDADSDEPAPTQYLEPEPEPVPVRTEYAEEPVADEYDSVESYMQRLLDRNRKSSTPEVHVSDRYVSSTTPARQKRAAAQTVSEFDDSVPTPNVEPEAPAEVKPVVPRNPVDTLKMRAGLDSLRHVANISARHAIAQSKWKKMRTTVAMQGFLVAIAGVVGMSIVTGKWLGLSGTDLWGWLALLIAAALGVKVFLDVREIKHSKGGKRPKAETPEPSATPAAVVPASTETGDENTV